MHTCKALLQQAYPNERNEEQDNKSNGVYMHKNNSNNDSILEQLKHLNPSKSLFYDFIAVDACQKGLFNSTLFMRSYVRYAIQQRQEVEWGLSALDFPLICPQFPFLAGSSANNTIVTNSEEEASSVKGDMVLDRFGGPICYEDWLFIFVAFVVVLLRLFLFS